MTAHITRDSHGVPHVIADDRRALYWGQGVVHATDRGLQMLLMRILVQGRMSELLTATDEALQIDTFFRKMNWCADARPDTNALDEQTNDYLVAYCEGASSVFGKWTPWELKLLGYRAEPWQVEDMVAISRMVGYVSLQQSQADVERLFVELVQAGIDREALEQLFPGLLQHADFELLSQVRLGERLVPNEILWGTPAAQHDGLQQLGRGRAQDSLRHAPSLQRSTPGRQSIAERVERSGFTGRSAIYGRRLPAGRTRRDDRTLERCRLGGHIHVCRRY